MVALALERGVEGEEWLAARARDLARFRELATEPTGRRAPRLKGERVAAKAAKLGRAELLRARALSTFLAAQASLRPDVIRFRDAYLGGRRVAPGHAEVLLRSRAPRYLTLDQFGQLGAPLVGHRGRVISTRRGFPSGRRLRQFLKQIDRPLNEASDPPDNDGAETAWESPREVEPADDHIVAVTLELSWRGPNGTSVKRRQHILQAVVEPQFLAVPTEISARGHLPIWRNSVFWDLNFLATRLAHAYPWAQGDAVWFVLTGTPPPIPAIIIRLSRRQGFDLRILKVNLEFQAWVSAETVLKTVRSLQRVLLGRTNRPIKDRTLLVLEFVAQRIEAAGGRRPTWDSMMKEWNRRHPRLAYVSYRRFQLDYRRAERQVVFPKDQVDID
jgi:hypothetical protein